MTAADVCDFYENKVEIYLTKVLARENRRQFLSFDRQRHEEPTGTEQINDRDSFRSAVESRDERRRMIDTSAREGG